MKYTIKVITNATVFFFAISFLSILDDIGSPWHVLPQDLRIEIAFPFGFYYPFKLGPEKTFGGWNGNNFVYDYLLTLIFTSLLMYSKTKLIKTR